MKRIILLTRSYNSELFLKCKATTVSLPYEHVRVKHYTCGHEDGVRYLVDIFIKYNEVADWIVSLDEDVFLLNPESIVELVNYMEENKYQFCGMPDGGVVKVREHNPVSANMFFNIFNVKWILPLLNRSKVHKTQWSNSLKKYTPHHLMKEGISYTYNMKELNYIFFFYLLNMGCKCLYLDGYTHDDGYSTILKDHVGKDVLLHTWLARTYTSESVHKDRIDKAHRYALSKLTA